MWFFRLLSRIPFPLLYSLAWFIYLVLYYVVCYRRAVVDQNLKQAFPEKSDVEIRHLARGFYRHFSRLTLEILKARTMTQEQFRERVTLVNEQLLLDRVAEGKQSVIILTIHQGNWEWALHGVSSHTSLPMDAIYKPLHHSGWNKFIHEVRSRFGSRPVAMADAAKDLISRRREFRVFVMVADQSAPVAKGLWLNFLNGEAVFYEGAEKIAQLTKFPVLFAQSRVTSAGRYEVVFHELADPPYEKGSHTIVERYVQLAERVIHQQPETFLWSNRRWKKKRPSHL